MNLTIWVICLFVYGIGLTAAWLWLYNESDKLEEENRKLKQMNEGQRKAIDELQNRNWFLQDILEMEREA